MISKKWFMIVFLLTAAVSGALIANMGDKSEEELLEHIKNNFSYSSGQVAFSEINNDVGDREVLEMSENVFNSSSGFLVNTSSHENQVKLDLYHMGSSSVNPGILQKAKTKNGTLSLLITREQPTEVTADMSLQVNRYEVNASQHDVDEIIFEEVEYRDKKSVYYTSKLSEIVDSFSLKYRGRWDLESENYTLEIGEEKLK